MPVRPDQVRPHPVHRNRCAPVRVVPHFFRPSCPQCGQLRVESPRASITPNARRLDLIAAARQELLDLVRAHPSNRGKAAVEDVGRHGLALGHRALHSRKPQCWPVVVKPKCANTLARHDQIFSVDCLWLALSLKRAHVMNQSQIKSRRKSAASSKYSETNLLDSDTSSLIASSTRCVSDSDSAFLRL